MSCPSPYFLIAMTSTAGSRSSNCRLVYVDLISWHDAAQGKGSTASAAGPKVGSGGGGGALASLESLPDAGGTAALRLLGRLDEQLAAAVQVGLAGLRT